MRRLTGLLGLIALTFGLSSPALAATINHIGPEGDEVQVLVGVPAGVDVDLDGVAASIGGQDVAARAVLASDTTDLVRTTVLAIDVSNSMAGARIEAAARAAQVYLDTVPSDLRIGIVTYARDVTRALEPTTDRAAARAVIDGLELQRQTALYDGIIEAVAMAGDDGARSVLVLSDGRDTTDTELAAPLAAITDARVHVDVVTLEFTGRGAAPLRDLAAAGGGAVIDADSNNLERTFTAEAESLGRQVLVTAAVPSGVGEQAEVTVLLPAAGGDLRVTAFGQVRPAVDAEPPAPPPVAGTGGFAWPAVSATWMYAGVGALGVGMLGLLIAVMVGSRPQPASVEDRIGAYAVAGGGAGATEHVAFGDQARGAATKMLNRNKGLEAKVNARLVAAGSAMKPAEWILMHGGIAIGAAFVGFLLGGGSFLWLIVFLAIGALVPWVWLGLKRSRRLNKFQAALADTLQMIAGGLQAGLSITQAIDAVVKEGNEPISGEFKRVLIENRLGVPLEAAMDDVAARMQSKDFAWVVMAIRIQREVGGNLAELLLTVAGTLREREYLRRQVKTLSAEGRLSAWVLGGLPPLFLVYLTLTQWEYVNVLFTDIRGIVMLVGGSLWLAIGAFWMSKLVKVEV
ncbi:type II secretion system F family protein [Nocardioides limicola]|uniref:type II secretion system F family protein n=1 Tax=Nocardioides limicola TaxID=2803368 RepID=UPI00193C802B|nr:type II secretion system F family protein [Nocardioides sp. DJM-14]